MPRLSQLLFALLSLSVCQLVTLSAPPPATTPATQPASTSITGTLATKDTVTRIAAIDRAFANVLKTSEKNPKDKFLYEGAYDAKTQTFAIKNLLPTRSYDLVIWTENAGHEKIRWEGVSMDYHRAILPASNPDNTPAPATDEDKTWLESFVKEMPALYDKARVLHLAADHKHATLLVELARTREFHSDKGGEIIYRVELWYFENLFGGWAKDKNTEKVLARVRTTADGLEKNWQFLPLMGGLMPNASDKPLTITLPEKPTERNGLAGKIP